MRTFLSSESAPWGILDNWLDQGHAFGVFTVLDDHASGEGWLARVKGDRHGVWGLAVVDGVVGGPADRLREALNQGQRRQVKGLSGSKLPVRVLPPQDGAVRKAVAVVEESDNDAPCNVVQDRQSEVRRILRYSQSRRGQGRWVHLHRFGTPIGTLWTDDAQALGFIPEPGQFVALLVSAISSACALGTPASWVFDDLAAWASRDRWAGPVERGDLATLGSGSERR